MREVVGAPTEKHHSILFAAGFNPSKVGARQVFRDSDFGLPFTVY
jgi:hypothetical protein